MVLEAVCAGTAGVAASPAFEECTGRASVHPVLSTTSYCCGAGSGADVSFFVGCPPRTCRFMLFDLREQVRLILTARHRA